MNDDPLWYKDAVIYEMHVRAFHDKDGDGIGDFAGLREKVDYLADLGVTAIWLLPFTASPLKDDGYDTADYTTVHPRYGAIDDFRLFLEDAHARGMRVITELVINHTSDQHTWFQRARRAPPGSPERNFYVWSDNPEKYAGVPLMFPDFETSNWTWDPIARQYYWHRFYSHQPDLNFDSPAVRAAILPVIDFWFGLGVDGLRLDAVPYLFEREGTSCEHLPETHAYLKELRKYVDENYPHRMFLAEANAWPEDMVSYFGTGDECHMAFHFPLMPRLFMALHQEDRFPILDIFEQTPPLPDNCQWCLFLRNHDELTLAMVTDEERDSLYSAYTQDRQARLFLGIRHRLAPLLRNDRRRMELMNALLFSLPGTPVIYYGDEIGMGDNIYLGDRNGVRTPMQWSADRNAGFSRANSQKLYLPIIIESEYHYEAVNVDAQQNNSSSLLWWMKRLIALRKQHRAFGRGTIDFLRPENPKVLAYVRRYEGECLLVVANLSRFVQPAQLNLAEFAGLIPEELFGRTRFPAITESPYSLTLGPHGFCWFSLIPAPNALRLDSMVLLPTADWRELVQGIGRRALARYLQVRSNSAGREALDCRVVESLPLPFPGFDVRVMTARIETSAETSEPVLQPLARVPVDYLPLGEGLLEQVTVARTAGPAAYVFCDPLILPEYRTALLDLISAGVKLTMPGGAELAGTPLAGFAEATQALTVDSDALPVLDEFQQLSVIIGQQVLLHVFRRADEGVSPDIEVGRFLTETARFDGFSPLLGYIDLRRPGREPNTFAAVHRCGPDQKSAWQWILDQASRFFETVSALSAETTLGEAPSPGVGFLAGPMSPDWEQWISPYIDSARLLGNFTGRLHAALASDPVHPAVAPAPFTHQSLRSWYQTLRNRSARLLKFLVDSRPSLSAAVQQLAQQILDRQNALYSVLRFALDGQLAAGRRIRCHGDLHLGKLLVAGRTILLPSFEGDVTRPLSERRIKSSPLRDVASLIRSLDYAAGVIRLDLLDAPGHNPAAVRAKDSAGLEPFAQAWYDRLGFECWTAYCEAAARAELLPHSEAARNRALALELLDRTLREAHYDVSLRSNRALISLAALLRLIAYLEEKP